MARSQKLPTSSLFDLQRASDYILSNKTQEFRAVRLYEFLVVLHCGEALAEANRRAKKATFLSKIHVQKRYLRSARVQAARRILAQKHIDPKSKAGKSLLRLVGSLERQTHTLDARTLDRHVNASQATVQAVASLIEFSYRIPLQALSGRSKGGITMALDLVPSHKEQFRIEDVNLKECWRTKQAVAPFLYLIYRQGLLSPPPALNSKHFSNRILKLVRSPELRSFFDDYNELILDLSSKNYRYSALKSGCWCISGPTASLVRQPFSAKRDPTLWTNIKSYSASTT